MLNEKTIVIYHIMAENSTFPLPFSDGGESAINIRNPYPHSPHTPKHFALSGIFGSENFALSGKSY